MLSINASDVVKKPSYVTRPEEITFIKDAKRDIIKSVILPYALYEKIKERLEDEIYLMQNKAALDKESYEAFSAIDEAGAEDLS